MKKLTTRRSDSPATKRAARQYNAIVDLQVDCRRRLYVQVEHVLWRLVKILGHEKTKNPGRMELGERPGWVYVTVGCYGAYGQGGQSAVNRLLILWREHVLRDYRRARKEQGER